MDRGDFDFEIVLESLFDFDPGLADRGVELGIFRIADIVVEGIDECAGFERRDGVVEFEADEAGDIA